MKGRLAQLAELKRLTEMVMEAELSRLEIATRACQALRDDLADLERLGTAASSEPDETPMVLAQQTVLFQSWRQEERARLNTRLAACLAERETTLDQARRAFGRDRAIEGLQKKETHRFSKA